MDIGVIGLGIVGKAICFGFSKLGHGIKIHDIKLDTTLDQLMDTDIIYVCVPTPSTEEGQCNTSIVKKVVADIDDKGYTGIVAIKSTVEPGTTAELQKKYANLSLCFVPEFLRERCAIADFTENHDVCIVGTEHEYVFNKISESHGKYPKKFFQCSTTEAELCKYFSNAYNATLITFANSFYELCEAHGVEYGNVKDICVNRDHINDAYVDVSSNFRAFGGTCLPKDLRAISHIVKEKGIDVGFFDCILRENSKYKTTVFDGMRQG